MTTIAACPASQAEPQIPPPSGTTTAAHYLRLDVEHLRGCALDVEDGDPLFNGPQHARLTRWGVAKILPGTSSPCAGATPLPPRSAERPGGECEPGQRLASTGRLPVSNPLRPQGRARFPAPAVPRMFRIMVGAAEVLSLKRSRSRWRCAPPRPPARLAACKKVGVRSQELAVRGISLVVSLPPQHATGKDRRR